MAFWEARTTHTVNSSFKRIGTAASPATTPPSAKLTLDEAVSTGEFYCSNIQPLKRKYTSWTLGNLAGGLQILYGQTSDRLSETEEIPLVRTLYRFQLCCNLSGHGYNEPIFSRAPEYEGSDVSELLQSLFDPWEIKEIVCIHEFAMQTYRELSPVNRNWPNLLRSVPERTGRNSRGSGLILGG
ncbi:hypothetical protein N7447_008212 [Penicillium robsamsonii]|uniref:uncharacterized protein n=1 Tax=Penicillium robsamsonii TaxID=1792511 RepID=UPI0025469986|nr:uncharacterized protein N7447_008212 [Penicillium robsamsonii]KAJ5815979.1 hypothetical protein N7447_008212 [Penicillium robsamsonii]